jgi:hypothetical protein
MFRIRSFPKKSLKWWHSKASSIDFDPDFQRTSRVWRGREQAFLIDSILNGFDIPKIYVADFTTHNVPELNRRDKSYAVIDGKQRLTAINAFLDDKFPLNKKFVLISDPTLKLGGLRFSELKVHHKPSADAVHKFVLDVKAIETDDRKKINDVFLRLNKASKALNGAEVRNALIGRAVDSIRVIANHRFFKRRIRFATDRSQEKNAAAKILLLEYEGNRFVDTKKRNLDSFVVAIGEQGSGRFNGTIKRVRSNLNALADVFQNTDALLGAQGHIPLYYMFISRLKSSDRRRVRSFLEQFERLRVRNRKSQSHIADLDAYDLASRSTNDMRSFQTRLRVLRSRFASWKRAGSKGQ